MSVAEVIGPSQERLGNASLTAALGLSLWVASGSLVLALVGGLGEHPARRAGVGAALVLALLAGLVWREPIGRALRRSPDLVVVIAMLQLVAAVVDEPLGGAYHAVSLTSIGVAVVVASSRTVWLCVGVLELGYLAGILISSTPAELAREHKLGGAIGVLLGPLFAAFLLLALRFLLSRLTLDPVRTLASVRGSAPALTAGLRAAIQRGDGPRLLTPPSTRRSPLTPTEIETVERLAAGRAPKQIAADRGVALATIRTHLKHAKRKTGARTQRELATFPTHPDWPYLDGLS